MAGRNAADIVFLVDASGSMAPCIDGLRRNLSGFLDTFKSNANESWDVRLDIVAHCSSDNTHSIHSALSENLWTTLYHGGQDPFFTRDPEVVKKALALIEPAGGESPLVALDFALDAPWRDSSEARRIVIFLTDEPHETSDKPDQHRTKLDAIIGKIQALKVMLFLVAPDSADYETLTSVDRADWEKVPEGDGMDKVDLGRVLRQIAKSISASQTPLGSVPKVERGLFGQAGWGTGSFSGVGD